MKLINTSNCVFWISVETCIFWAEIAGKSARLVNASTIPRFANGKFNSKWFSIANRGISTLNGIERSLRKHYNDNFKVCFVQPVDSIISITNHLDTSTHSRNLILLLISCS